MVYSDIIEKGMPMTLIMVANLVLFHMNYELCVMTYIDVRFC
jgi:hypothetical protein